MILKLSTEQETFHFESGSYNIFLMGGLKVSLGSDFKVDIKSKNSQNNILVQPTAPIASLENGSRAVRIFQFEIMERGSYAVSIRNPSSLKVQRSLLFSKNLIFGNTDLNDCRILISKILR